ncbi:MAG: hypothetical protein U0S12_10490 [Fimbriimonadales bacterium]
MSAMTSATDNAGKMIYGLTLKAEPGTPSGDHEGNPRGRGRRRGAQV